MKLDPLVFLALALLAGAILGMVTALLIDAIRAWLRHQPTWKIIESPSDGFKLHQRAILPPHQSAARPSNVMALAAGVCPACGRRHMLDGACTGTNHDSAPKEAA